MSTPTARRRDVAVGLIVAEDGRLLLQLRDATPGVPGAGMWGLFGGRVEPGERVSAAFLREMREELGWRPRRFEPYLTADAEWDVPVRSHVFAAHLDVPEGQLVLGEGQALGLFAPEALPEGIVPGIAPLIRDFAASDAYRRARRAWDALTATALLIDREGRFLLQHRDDKPGIANPGLWGSFGGEIEPFETPEEGFLREIGEELSWRPTRYEIYGAFPYRPDEHRWLLVYVYAALVDVPEERLVLGEGQGMGFFPPDALPADTVRDLATLIARFAGDEAYARLRRAG